MSLTKKQEEEELLYEPKPSSGTDKKKRIKNLKNKLFIQFLACLFAKFRRGGPSGATTLREPTRATRKNDYETANSSKTFATGELEGRDRLTQHLHSPVLFAENDFLVKFFFSFPNNTAHTNIRRRSVTRQHAKLTHRQHSPVSRYLHLSLLAV